MQLAYPTRTLEHDCTCETQLFTFLFTARGVQGGAGLSGRCWRQSIFGFLKSAPSPRYTILELRLPPCNAISDSRPPLSNTSSEDFKNIFFRRKIRQKPGDSEAGGN